jgi:hypothetical protein
VAFNHGVPDSNSTFGVDRLRVVEATQEHITLKGTSRYGEPEEGIIDRRTGHAEITWYHAGQRPSILSGKPQKQFIFECKPSANALF